MQVASQVLYRVYFQHKRSSTVKSNARNTLSIHTGCSKTRVPNFKVLKIEQIMQKTQFLSYFVAN